MVALYIAETKTTSMRPRSRSATSSHHETLVDSSTTKEKPTFKNINLECNSLKKIVSCQACNKPHGRSIVSHYVNEHPNSEVLVSRLAPEAAECLRTRKGLNQCKIMRPPGRTGYAYQQFCFFCNVYKCFNRSAWIIHMARHTGYYRFKCNDCSRLFAAKPQYSRCRQINDFEKIPQPQLHKKDVKAYVCDLCNYVRFHQKEIEMHLTNEHVDDSNKFTEFLFLTFPDKKSKSKPKNKFLDDFIVQSDSEYETVTEGEYGSDLKSECESDWVSEDEANELLKELQDDNDENDDWCFENDDMDIEYDGMDFVGKLEHCFTLYKFSHNVQHLTE